jgi:hypothetical protein
MLGNARYRTHEGASHTPQPCAIPGLRAPCWILPPVSRFPGRSLMTCRAPTCGHAHLRSRLSEVYNSVKVCLIAFVKAVLLQGSLMKPF